MDVDGYKIWSTSTNLHQRDCDLSISQCFLNHVFILAISTVVMLIVVTIIIFRTMSVLAGWESINSLALLYNAKDAANFYSGSLNTVTNPDLAFTIVGPNSRLPDRRVLQKFPKS